jgi:hypothetical protein
MSPPEVTTVLGKRSRAGQLFTDNNEKGSVFVRSPTAKGIEFKDAVYIKSVMVVPGYLVTRRSYN